MTAVVCGIVAKRGRPWWELSESEVKDLAAALDPPLARIPLPEKELGVVAELGALGFVCFAIFAPRMDLDNKQKAAHAALRGATSEVVQEAERIARAHAETPYGQNVEDFGRHRVEQETAPDLVEYTGITVAETEPDLIVSTDAAARAGGITPERIVEIRRDMHVEGELLDAYPGVPTLDDGTPLDRGLPEPAGE